MNATATPRYPTATIAVRAEQRAPAPSSGPRRAVRPHPRGTRDRRRNGRRW